MARIPTVLVYAVKDDRVLLMHRHKEPNLGLWIAPGGKIEVDESPHDAACREMQEETGLIVDELVWRGLCTAVSPLPGWQWMLFIYVTRSFHGSLQEDLREGALAWVGVDTYLSEMAIPQADRTRCIVASATSRAFRPPSRSTSRTVSGFRSSSA